MVSNRRALGTTRGRRGVAIASTSALALALVTRHLGRKPLWLDESVTISVARRPLGRILFVLTHHDANAGLYDVLLHVWLKFGHSAAWDRGLSALWFVATAGLAAWVASRWRGEGFGFACGVLVATNPFLLFYGQEARSFSLSVLLAVASTAALFWREGEPSPGGYVAATLGLLYANLFAVLFVGSQALAVAVAYRRRGRPMPRELKRGLLAIAAGALPLLVLMLTRERSQISWLGQPTIRDLGRTFRSMSGGSLGLVAMVGLAVIALVAARGAGDRVLIWALAVSFVVPPVVLWLFARLVPVFLDRYVISSVVGVIGLAAVGLDVIRERAGLAIAVVGLVALTFFGLQRVAAIERAPVKYENVPAVVAFISRDFRPGDAIGFGGGGLRTAIDAYVSNPSVFPLDIALSPGGEARRQHDLYAHEVSSDVLARRLVAVGRLWLVTDPTDQRYPSYGPFRSLRPEMMRDYVPGVRASFLGIDVTLYVRGGSGP